MAPRVLGLDLSVTGTGVAWKDGRTYTVTPDLEGDARLGEIRDAVRLAAGGCPKGTRGTNWWVDLAVLEDVPPVRAASTAVLGMVHGVVRTMLIEAGVPYALVPPSSLKKYATGRGNAPKPDLRMALFQRTGADIRDDNQVDATWLRLMGLDALGHPAVALPQAHRAVLDKIHWPTGGKR
ncbi:hypothetical protein J0910_00510 [Nocardiopsis sp. CNT-189]|uniref:hypothetical protein n=1 Tax=Nocardiopsis oceanisediminis TaxID=2816862 RepID=UPI003B38E5F7